MIPRLLAAVLLLCALCLPAGARAAAAVWVATGFDNPESVLWDRQRQAIYVSNVNGAAPDKDGNGYISRLSADGRILTRKWVTGLDGPKGMAVYKGRLYVADIDRLVVVDTATGHVVETYPAPGAKVLNDVSANADGVIWVTDVQDDALWRLAEGRFEKWLADPALQAPDGLEAQADRLIVASWGGMGDGNRFPGGLKAVSLTDKSIRDIAPAIGNLAGLESDGHGGWLVSDYVQGTVFHVTPAGRVSVLLHLGKGSANIGLLPERHLLLVPMMMDGRVAAWRLR